MMALLPSSAACSAAANAVEPLPRITRSYLHALMCLLLQLDRASLAGQAHQAWDRHWLALVLCKAQLPGVMLAACVVTQPICVPPQRFSPPFAAWPLHRTSVRPRVTAADP